MLPPAPPAHCAAHHRHRSGLSTGGASASPARRRHRLRRRRALAEAGNRPARVYYHERARRGPDAARARARPGSPGPRARPTRRARDLLDEPGDDDARAAAAPSTRSRTGPRRRSRSAPPGAESRTEGTAWRLTGMLSAPGWRVGRSRLVPEARPAASASSRAPARCRAAARSAARYAWSPRAGRARSSFRRRSRAVQRTRPPWRSAICFDEGEPQVHAAGPALDWPGRR